MTAPHLDAETYRVLFETIGPEEMSRKGYGSRAGIYRRRHSIEKRIGRPLIPGDKATRRPSEPALHPHRACVALPNGIALVGSDAHIWPGPKSTAIRAFIHFCKELKPALVVLNGDVLDCSTISRHPPIGWEARPTVQQEIETGQETLGEIEAAAGKAEKCWTLGNHDARYETRLATVAPEFAKIAGTHLKDFFPLWRPAWSCWVNDQVVIKHRYKGGFGATRANTLNSGKSMVTGHLHSLKVTPFTDYNGTRFGVDTGCLADPSHKAFVDYTEDAPLDWRSGFVVLTFHKGRLLWPEVVSVFDADHVEFRGQIIPV